MAAGVSGHAGSGADLAADLEIHRKSRQLPSQSRAGAIEVSEPYGAPLLEPGGQLRARRLSGGSHQLSFGPVSVAVLRDDAKRAGLRAVDSAGGAGDGIFFLGLGVGPFRSRAPAAALAVPAEVGAVPAAGDHHAVPQRGGCHRAAG